MLCMIRIELHLSCFGSRPNIALFSSDDSPLLSLNRSLPTIIIIAKFTAGILFLWQFYPFVITHSLINAVNATPTYPFLLNASLCCNAKRTRKLSYGATVVLYFSFLLVQTRPTCIIAYDQSAVCFAVKVHYIKASLTNTFTASCSSKL